MVDLRRAAAIVGVHEHVTRYAPDKSELQIQGESVIKALEDAGLVKSDVDGLFTASMAVRNSGLNLADYLDLYPKHLDNTTHNLGTSTLAVTLQPTNCCSTIPSTYGDRNALLDLLESVVSSSPKGRGGKSSSDANSCADSIQLTVNVNPLPTASIAPNSGGTICSKDSTLIIVQLTGNPPWDILHTINGTVQSNINTSNNPFLIYTNTDGNYDHPMDPFLLILVISILSFL